MLFSKSPMLLEGVSSPTKTCGVWDVQSTLLLSRQKSGPQVCLGTALCLGEEGGPSFGEFQTCYSSF